VGLLTGYGAAIRPNYFYQVNFLKVEKEILVKKANAFNRIKSRHERSACNPIDVCSCRRHRLNRRSPIREQARYGAEIYSVGENAQYVRESKCGNGDFAMLIPYC
jgi:hypothetical protein